MKVSPICHHAVTDDKPVTVTCHPHYSSAVTVTPGAECYVITLRAIPNWPTPPDAPQANVERTSGIVEGDHGQ